MGLRLRHVGSFDFTWGDFRDFVIHSKNGSALALSQHGEQVLWKLTDHLLAVIADALHGANWQRGGGKGLKPKPLPRPGMEESAASVGSDPIPISEFDKWWNGE